MRLLDELIIVIPIGAALIVEIFTLAAFP